MFSLRRALPLLIATLLAVPAVNACAATFTVTSDADDGGAGTLRAAINLANADVNTADVIQFAPNVRGTIDLTQIGDTALGNSAFGLRGPVEIQGPGADVLNVRRASGGDYRIFRVNSGVVATISGLTISGGNPAGSDLSGGGIRNQGNLTLSACAVSDNTAASFGGGIFNTGGALNVQSCTISGNTANDTIGNTGGGIDNSIGTLEVSNSTLSGNSVPNGDFNGGGIWTGGATTITDCTITDNGASGTGSASGLFVLSGSTTVSNTIVAANRNNAAQPDVARNNGAVNSGGSNLIGNPGAIAFNGAGDQTGNAAAPRNPQIGALAFNGGPTRTHALLSGSPAIDRGNSALATDQRGAPRPFNGDGIGTAADDIGAFELATDPTGASALVVTTPDDVSFADGLISLREAIDTANTDGVSSTITFAPAVFNVPRTITLDPTRGELVSSTITTINGPDDAVLTVSGNGASRVLRVTGGVSTIDDVVFANGNGVGNGRLGLGGCVYVSGGTLLLSRCVVTGGSTGLGGGIYVINATLNLSNCTLTRNNSNQGGAINNNSSATTNIVGCTITDNSAPGGGSGGGIINFSTLNIGNSIVAGNTASNGPDIFQFNNPLTSGASRGFNLIGTPVSGGGTFTPAASDQVGTSNSAPLDAGFERDAANGNRPFLKDNGGGTLTVALLINSRAVNSGGGLLSEDQRNVARPQSGRRDIGAFELAASNFTPSLIVTTLADEDNGTSDARLGTGTSLREAIIRANGDGVASEITFATSGVIRLSSALPNLVGNGTLTITGPQAGITISGDANGSGANDSGDVGLFFVISSADVTLDKLTLRGGRRDNGFGGAISSFGKLTVISSTLLDNFAARGGAIHNETPSVSAGGGDPARFTLLRNCTIAGNTAMFTGGGVNNDTGLTVIESCTIAGNSAPNGGGSGVASYGDTSARTRVSNSIISGNSASDVDFVFVSANSFESLGFNLIGTGNATGNFTGEGDVTGNTDPGLAPLADNGGGVQTRALLPGSAAFNAGDPSVTGAGQNDGRGAGFPRVRNGRLDIGAFERLDTVPTIASVTLTPAAPKTNETVTATVVASDSDAGDSVSYAYVWKVTRAGTTTVVKTTPASAGATDTLDLSVPGNGDKNDVVTVEVTVNDRDGLAAGRSAVATVANSAPSIGPSAITTTTNRAVVSRPSFVNDPDGDALTFSASGVNGGTVSAFSGNDGLFLFTPGASAGNAGFLLTVSDGTATASAPQSISVVAAAAGTPLVYTAVGASDVQGVGASDYNASTGQSPARAYAPLLLGRQNAMYGAGAFTLSRRAVNGFTAADARRMVGGTSLLQLAVADAPRSVTVWYGPNDVVGFASKTPNPTTAQVQAFLTQFGADYGAIIGALKTSGRAVAVANVPPLGNFPIADALGLSATQKAQLNQLCGSVSGVIGQVAAQNGVPVVDLFGGNAFEAGDISSDGFHPSDAGYAKLANLFFALLRPQLNRAPVANAQTVTVVEGQSVSGTLTATDPDGDETAPPTFAKASDPAGGSVVVNADGTFTYTSNGTRGADSFTFVASDGGASSAPATVTINVGETPSFVVTTTADVTDSADGLTSLREAIEFANGDGVNSAITFATSGVIRLSSALPNLVDNGTLTITGPQAGVTISGDANNSGANDSGDVGIFRVNSRADVTLDNLTLRGGRNDEFGSNVGGAIISFGKLTMTGSTLLDNMAGFGGAIYSATPDTSAGGSDPAQFTLLRNCTLSGNTATISGGGVYNNNGLTVIESCTIAGNSAPDGEGGGIASFGASATRTRVSNSIVAGNSTSDVDFVSENTNTFESLGFNLIGEGNATGNFTGDGDVTGNTDPGLAPLADNGGSTATRALLAGSPALDKGNTTLTLDQRGLTRPFDDPRIAPAQGGNNADIGAFESQVIFNAAPSVTDVAVSTDEDTARAFAASDFDAGFSDTDNDTLQSVRILSLPDSGALTLDGAAVTVGQVVARADIAQLVYVPAADFNGPASFAYNASDGQAFTASDASVNITVDSVNDAPSFLVGGAQTVAEDAGTQGVVGFARDISAGAANENTQTLTFIVSNDNPGLFSSQPEINADGNLSYRPADDASGSATVTVVLKDDGGVLNGGVDASAPQSFVITVSAVNDAPVALADAYLTDDNVTLTVSAADGVLQNDGDIDSSGLTATLETDVSRGVLTFNSDGSFTYVPERGFSGTTAFSYRAFDGALSSEAVNVTLGVNVTPQPINFGVSVTPKAPRTNDTLTATPVIADADATGVSYSYAWSVGGVVKQDGPFNTFDLGVAGQGDKGDNISVVVSAVRGIDSGSATNAVTVFNSAPFAFSQSGTAQGGVAQTFTLRGADFDAEALTFKRVGGPKSGTASIVNNADGSATLTYTALANFGGVEVIRFVAIDESGRPSTPATLSIAVTAQAPPAPPNRAPSANNVTASTTSGVEVAIPLSGSDPDGAPITFKRVGGPRNGGGEIRLDSDGVFKMFYTPRANFVGNEVIRFVALDTIGKPSAVATMTINVSGAPSASGALKSGAEAPSGGGS